ncbi:MAG: hypothetical protein QN142_02630 [Armatimonadota bacterium]|nr:hypothetical protein [Armatimonadota bacterium]MDR7408232.1 hypothetical protein [Armatimonadota bacterium]MDR7410686.1 hypothetical protein [Armatimonadota bacterium]MDR7441024.1 hypothetical protein [Armatimonadota bacterium]
MAHLALVLGVALQKALQRAGLTMALEPALEALRPIRLVELELPFGSARLVTRPTPHGQAVLQAVESSSCGPPRSLVAGSGQGGDVGRNLASAMA